MGAHGEALSGERGKSWFLTFVVKVEPARKAGETSGQAEEHDKRSVDRKQGVVFEAANDGAKLCTADGVRSIDRDLRGNAQSVSRRGGDLNPGEGRVLQSARQRQDNNGGKWCEPISLDDDGGARFPAVALKGNNDDVAALGQSRSSQMSAVARSQNSHSAWAACV